MSKINDKDRKRAPTLADVGRAAGVSAMAASIVFNKGRSNSRISRDTRERILAAAAKLKYRPNLAARALVSRRINTIGVAAVVEGGELNHYFLDILNGILAAAARYGQNTTVFTLHDWNEGPSGLCEFCDGRIDGLILLAPTFNRQNGSGAPSHTPVVSIHANHLLPGVVNIESDEERGAYALVNHLIARGHRRIMHLAGPAGLTGSERRIRGFRRALYEAEIPIARQMIVTGGYTTEVGRETMRDWLSRHPGELLPQSVFCANDAAALGCIEALAEVGLRVPDDISVAGFDDTLAARLVVPQLTSVRQPLREMGTYAVERLLARIDDPASLSDDIPDPVVFPIELALRASVGAPSALERVTPAP